MGGVFTPYTRDSAKKVRLTFLNSSAYVVSIIRLVSALQVGSLDSPCTLGPLIRKSKTTCDPLGRMNANRCTKGDSIPAALVSEVELCFGFLVVSIPTYRSIYRKMTDGLASALEARIRKPYQVGAGSYGSNNSAPYTFQVSAQRTLSPAQMGIVILNDIQLVRHVQHNGDWIRVAENEHDRSRF